jgi:hypothetical protein
VDNRKLSAQNPEPFFEKRWSLINTPYFLVQPQENEDICFPDLQNKEDPTPPEFVLRVHRGRSVSILFVWLKEECLVNEAHESDVSRVSA